MRCGVTVLWRKEISVCRLALAHLWRHDVLVLDGQHLPELQGRTPAEQSIGVQGLGMRVLACREPTAFVTDHSAVPVTHLILHRASASLSALASVRNGDEDFSPDPVSQFAALSLAAPTTREAPRLANPRTRPRGLDGTCACRRDIQEKTLKTHYPQHTIA